MEKKGFLEKIDTIYTKITKKIIGDTSSNTDASFTSPIDTIKTFTQNNIEKIKKVGIKETILTMGTPIDEKALHYDEVIKREKQELKEEAKRTKEKAKLAKEEAKALKSGASKKKSSDKKTSTKKSTTTKTKKEASTTSPKKKASTKTKKAESKSATTKKTPAKKTVTKKTTDKKTTADKKAATKKTTTATKKPTTKTSSTTKTISKKEASTKKSSTSTKPSKRDEKIALYIKDIQKHYGEVDEAFVAIIVKNLGPSIYRKDAESVACSDPKELDTVRKNFLMKKLGIDASQSVLDAAIADVCKELKATRIKYRATFYYALAKKFKKESVLS